MVDAYLYVLRMRDKSRSETAELFNGLVEGRNNVSIFNEDSNRASNFECNAINITVIENFHMSNGDGNRDGNSGNVNGSINGSDNNHNNH